MWSLPPGQGEDIELFAAEDDVITNVILQGYWLLCVSEQVGGDKGLPCPGCVWAAAWSEALTWRWGGVETFQETLSR